LLLRVRPLLLLLLLLLRLLLLLLELSLGRRLLELLVIAARSCSRRTPLSVGLCVGAKVALWAAAAKASNAAATPAGATSSANDTSCPYPSSDKGLLL
jgi:hypothetical protein